MTQEQFEKLDSCYYKYDINSRCVEEIVDARKLICPQRFDLYALLLYIDHKVKGVKNDIYAYNVYKERTRTITAFKMSETGNDSKNSFQDFITVFDNLIEDTQKGNFDENRTLIPVDKNYVLMDGAHRTACAAYFGKKVHVLRFVEMESLHMSWEHLQNGIIPESVLDAMALESCNWHNNLHMLFMWPKAFLKKGTLQKAYKYIAGRSYVVYKKEVKMRYSAIRNLMIQLYGHMDWVGDIDNDFAGTFAKADEVWDVNGMCGFVLIQAPSCEYVLDMKQEIRNMFGIGLASMHSTDNMREARIATNAIFNPNSLQFLQYGVPTKYKEVYRSLDSFKKQLNEQNIDRNNVLLSPDLSLAIYGIRETKDYCYISNNIDVRQSCLKKISDSEPNSSFLELFGDNLFDIITSPSNFYWFNELKFFSLDNVLKYKSRRFEIGHDDNDRADVLSIQDTIKKDAKDSRYDNIKIVFRRNKRKLQYSYYEFRRQLFTSLHVYELVKYIKKNG